MVDAHLGEYFIAELISLLCTSAAHALQASVQARAQHGPAISPSAAAPNDPSQVQLDEAYRSRMDRIGYRVGWVLAERLAKDKPRIPRSTQSATTPPSPDPLEVIKFVCKDLWSAMYNKQADNLRTNHRGVFVIQDYGFRPFLRLSAPVGYEAELDKLCQKMLILPLAVIRGALMNLGTFQIRTATGSSTAPAPAPVPLPTVGKPVRS